MQPTARSGTDRQQPPAGLRPAMKTPRRTVALVELQRTTNNFFDIALITEIASAFEALDQNDKCQQAICRLIPEVGAVCGKAACTDMCGGPPAMGVPTATAASSSRWLAARRPGR